MVQIVLKDGILIFYSQSFISKLENASEFTEQRTLQILISQTQWGFCVEDTIFGAGRTQFVSSDPYNFHGISHEILFSLKLPVFN